MNKGSLVSIIIPAYNRADLIGETLDSVRAQTYPDWECIVVDDGSTDNTKKVVQRYVDEDSRFIQADRPETHKPGGNGARNYGFEISQGEYIQWFDSDDLMLPGFLEEHVSVLQKSNADFSICDLQIFFPKNDEKKKWLSNSWIHDSPDDFVSSYIMFNYGIGIISIVWRKNVLEGRRLFDESLQRSQEYEFFCRLFISMKLEKAVIDKVLVYYRQTPNNYINQIKAGNEIKIASALDAKLSVLDTVKKYDKLTDDLINYFITDAISYLQFDLDVTREKASNTIVACGYNKTNADRIVRVCDTIIKQTKNKANIKDLTSFALIKPSMISIQIYIARVKLAGTKKTIRQKLA